MADRRVEISQTFSVLTKLQSLSACCFPSDSFCGKLSIEFDLAALQSLHRLAILGNIALKGDFKQLAAAKLFKTLDLGYISTSAPAQLKLYAKAVELGCIKPDVQILYSFKRQAVVDDPEEQEYECQ